MMADPAPARVDAQPKAAPVLLDEKELGRRVGELFARPGFKIPVLPVTALEVMRLSRQSDIGVEKLIDVLSQDSMLAADILKLARSPVYAGLSQAKTLKEAAVRLGNAGVHRIVLEAVQRSVFRAPGLVQALEAVRKHGSAVGHLARVVSRHASLDPEFGFLCGLLHEIGLSAGLMALAADKTPKLDLAGWFTLERAHEEVAQVICHYWKLPPELGQVLAQHHAPPDSLSATSPMVSLLVVAEFLAEQDAAGLGHLMKQATGIDLPMEPADRRIDQARSTLRLDDRAWARLYEDAATTMANLDAEA
jgi:HD-like signal output (HDOD) protein